MQSLLLIATFRFSLRRECTLFARTPKIHDQSSHPPPRNHRHTQLQSIDTKNPASRSAKPPQNWPSPKREKAYFSLVKHFGLRPTVE
jgi:hypothetical protein